MKKIIILLLLLLSISTSTNASFWSPTSLNLYKNIDKWFENIKDRMETFELEWWQQKKWILSEINKYAIINQQPACLDESKNLSASTFNDIVDNSDISWKTWILRYLKPNCLDWSLQNEILITYLDLFRTYKIDKIKQSVLKSNQLYKVSKIWLYSDWDIDNSWFDLITDIEDIDKIIFADVVDYSWEPIKELDDALNSFLKPVTDAVEKLTSPNFWNQDNDNEIKYQTKPIKTPEIIIPEISDDIKDTQNSYLCVDDISNNWLSENAIDWLINNINKDIHWLAWVDSPLWINSEKNNNSADWSGFNPWSSIKAEKWSYEKVRDNSEWPCEDFFCINIDFTTYEHSLFWGWENITIEYLLNRSNKHLSKHAATSLIPAKMWTNEFELWLKDLNLPDIFHLSVQVSTKPIPILNIESTSKKDETDYSSENMMKEYYKLNWLDYNRRNDLILLNSVEQNKQNTNNSPWLTPEKLLEKQIENDLIAEERQKKIATMEKTIYSKVSYWVLWTFEEQFTELDKFTAWINEYVNTLYSLVKKLREIPIEY